MQGRFKMEYRLLTIVRYNYRDYNSASVNFFSKSGRVHIFVLTYNISHIAEISIAIAS
jgi:hypothetical protein